MAMPYGISSGAAECFLQMTSGVACCNFQTLPEQAAAALLWAPVRC